MSSGLSFFFADSCVYPIVVLQGLIGSERQLRLLEITLFLFYLEFDSFPFMIQRCSDTCILIDLERLQLLSCQKACWIICFFVLYEKGSIDQLHGLIVFTFGVFALDNRNYHRIAKCFKSLNGDQKIVVLKNCRDLDSVFEDAFGDSIKEFLGNVIQVLDFTMVEDHV